MLKHYAMKYAALFFSLILSSPICAEEPETKYSIGYPTVEEALKDLRSRPDLSDRIVVRRGWTHVVIEHGRDKTLWSFTPETHPAYPAAIKREILNKDGTVYIRMNILCEADKHECDALVEEYEQVNVNVRKRYQRSADRPKSFVKTAGKAIIQILDYDKKSFKLYRQSHERIGFSLYGKQELEYLTVECDKSVYYDIGTLTANLVGTLSIGLCIDNPVLTRDVVKNQRSSLQTVLGSLAGDIIKIDENLFETAPIGNNLTFHYFPIYVVGHGIMLGQTSVTISDDSNRAIIIQFSGQYLCDRLPDLKLCSDPKSTLKELSMKILVDSL